MRSRLPRMLLSSLTLLLPVAAPAQLQQPQLLADISDRRVSPSTRLYPSTNFVEMAGTLYFLGNDGIHGSEPWRTDGTPEGTWLVRDVCPGYCSGAIDFELVATADRIFFAGRDGLGEDELWVSDGTRGGTRPLVDRSEVSHTRPAWLTVVGEQIFFAARPRGSSAEELFVSDGTDRGTRRVLPSILGEAHLVHPGRFIVLGEGLFFFAQDPDHGFEPWITDGTNEGTQLLADLVPGPGGSASTGWRIGRSRHGIAVGQRAYFGTSLGGLWVTDGTPEGTQTVAVPGGISQVGRFAVVDGEVFFLASAPASGGELWVTDGSAAGTELVADLVPGTDSSWPMPLGVVGSKLLLAATTVETGYELWSTAGRGEGVELVADIQLGPANGLNPFSLLAERTVLRESLLLFSADSGEEGEEPWVTDGTPSGTRLLADLNAGPGGSSRSLFRLDGSLAYAGALYFFATTEEFGLAPWVSDGTLAGTRLLVDFNRQTSALREVLFFVNTQTAAAPAGLYFQARDAEHGTEVWTTDGTVAGTRRVVDLHPGPEDGVGGFYALPEMLWLHGSMYFTGFTSFDQDTSLWSTNGTTASTQRVLDPTTGEPIFGPRAFAEFRGSLAFATEAGVWKLATDGSLSLLGGGHPTYELVPAGRSLFFASDGSLWIATEEPGSAQRLRGGPPGLEAQDLASLVLAGPGGASDPVAPQAGEHRLFFLASDEQDGAELWASDGTAAGTRQVRDIHPGAGSSLTVWSTVARAPDLPIAPFGSGALVLADDGTHGTELWISDGTETGTRLLRDLRPGEKSSQPRELTALPGGAAFVADDGVRGRELWWTNGTVEGTRMLADLVPGSEGSYPTELTASGRSLYFAATTAEHGRELWCFDSATGEVNRETDLNPGEGSSSPMFLQPFDTTTGERALFFFATDGDTGFEPWIVLREAPRTVIRPDALRRFLPSR